MRKILWIGSPFFAHELVKCGWDLYFYNFEDTRVFYWQDLVEIADGPPDVLIVADKSRPPFVLGMENFPCLTVFYCVDSHIHSCYPYYAQGFDVCLVSLKDHIPRFQNLALDNSRILHTPPFAKSGDLPPPDQLWSGEEAITAWRDRERDLLFVGNVDPETTPERKQFMENLLELVPGLQVMRGNYRELFATAKVVLNYSELGDLNFRVFEALGCGACLLTPMVEHGFGDMFRPGRDLFTYEMKSWDDAAAQFEQIIQKPQACLSAAKSGLAKVNKYHRAINRAEALTNYLLNLGSSGKGRGYSHGRLMFQDITGLRLARVREIHYRYLRIIYLLLADNIDDPYLKEAYFKAGMNDF